MSSTNELLQELQQLHHHTESQEYASSSNDGAHEVQASRNIRNASSSKQQHATSTPSLKFVVYTICTSQRGDIYNSSVMQPSTSSTFAMKFRFGVLASRPADLSTVPLSFEGGFWWFSATCMRWYKSTLKLDGKRGDIRRESRVFAMFQTCTRHSGANLNKMSAGCRDNLPEPALHRLQA